MEQNESANTPPQDGQTPPQTPVTPVPVGAATQDDKTMAMLCHLLGLLTSFIGPLIIWLIKKDQSAYVNEQGKEALNFQITVAIAMVVASFSVAICIGFALVPAVGIADLVLCIMACIAANKGEPYRYPFCLRLIK
jgi:uncharacterized Tic20 family protein